MGICHSVIESGKDKKEIIQKLSGTFQQAKAKSYPELAYELNKGRTKQSISQSYSLITADEEAKSLILIYPKNEQLMDQLLIKYALKSCVVLGDLEGVGLNEIISKMSLCKVQVGAYITKEGKPGFYFFIIQSGKIRIEINGVYQKTLTKGDYFGELALILDTDRTASAIAENEVYLWCLERANFKRVVEYISAKKLEENKNFVENIKVLSKHLFNKLLRSYTK